MQYDDATVVLRVLRVFAVASILAIGLTARAVTAVQADTTDVAGDPPPAVADLPLFIMTRNSDGAIAQTTDPGRAVISGQFSHIGQFKGPILHGMAARAPFFHNGMAATLEEVVDFYNERFNGQFTAREKADLVAFLSAL